MLVVGFTILPRPTVFLIVLGVGFYMKVLYALPLVAEEGLRARYRELQPADHGFDQAKADQKAQDDLTVWRPVSSLSHILWPVKIGLIALVAFIIFTQEEYRPIALAALATILPEISKLLPELHKILGALNTDKPSIKV
jgi:hypothetical protein